MKVKELNKVISFLSTLHSLYSLTKEVSKDAKGFNLRVLKGSYSL